MFACFTLIAGYNNLEVAEYLLEHGADVNAQDKGGLIPLHNAASYGVSMLKFKSRKLHLHLLFDNLAQLESYSECFQPSQLCLTILWSRATLFTAFCSPHIV